MVSIPHELHDAQCDVCLYIDIMYINGMPFVSTISKKMKYHTTMRVADHTAPTIVSLVESILELYQWAGFQVMEVCTDCEFKPVLQVLQDNGWSFTTILPMVRNMFLRLSTRITSLWSIFMPLIMGFLTRCSHELLFATW